MSWLSGMIVLEVLLSLCIVGSIYGDGAKHTVDVILTEGLENLIRPVQYSLLPESDKTTNDKVRFQLKYSVLKSNSSHEQSCPISTYSSGVLTNDPDEVLKICDKKVHDSVFLISISPADKLSNFKRKTLFTVFPNMSNLLRDVFEALKWDNYFYFQGPIKGVRPRHSAGTALRKESRSADFTSADEVINRLREMTSQSEDTGSLRVVLDCDSVTAKEILFHKALPKLRLQFFLAEMVLDDSWLTQGVFEDVTWFRPVRSQEEENKMKLLKYFLRGSDTERPLSMEEILMFDAAETLKYIVKHSGTKTTADRKISSLLHRNHQHLSGLSGDITTTSSAEDKYEEEEEGANLSRQPPRAKLLRVRHLEGTTPIGTWNERGQFSKAVEVSQSRVKRDDNRYRVTTIIQKPYLTEKVSDTNLSGNDRYEGFLKDLMDRIAQDLNFTYALNLVKDKKFGIKDERSPGGWSGMIGEVLRNESDIALASLTITAVRAEVVHFSHSFMMTGISAMFSRSKAEVPSTFHFMSVMTPWTWVALVAAYIMVSIGFVVLRGTVSREVSEEAVKLEDGTSHATQPAWRIETRTLAGWILTMFWWIFMLTVVAALTSAHLASYLDQKDQKPHQTIEDLVSAGMDFGMLESGSTKAFFQNSKIPVFQRVWEIAKQKKGSFTKTYVEGVEKVREDNNLAFIGETHSFRYFANSKPCDIVLLPVELEKKEYGLATRKGSTISEMLDGEILKLRESGALRLLEHKWWKEKSECSSPYNAPSASHYMELTIVKLRGSFYLLLGGCILAILAAVFERYGKAKIRSRLSKHISWIN